MAQLRQTLTKTLTSPYQQALSHITRAGGYATAPISPAYRRLTELFAPGGTYMAGQKALIEEERKKSIAQAYGTAVQTGMWSGTTATGAQQRAGRYAQLALLQTEDKRIEMLASALEAMGMAEEARAVRAAQTYTAAGQIAASFYQPPRYTAPTQPTVGWHTQRAQQEYKKELAKLMA